MLFSLRALLVGVLCFVLFVTRHTSLLNSNARDTQTEAGFHPPHLDHGVPHLPLCTADCVAARQLPPPAVVALAALFEIETYRKSVPVGTPLYLIDHSNGYKTASESWGRATLPVGNQLANVVVQALRTAPQGCDVLLLGPGIDPSGPWMNVTALQRHIACGGAAAASGAVRTSDCRIYNPCLKFGTENNVAALQRYRFGYASSVGECAVCEVGGPALLLSSSAAKQLQPFPAESWQDVVLGIYAQLRAMKLRTVVCLEVIFEDRTPVSRPVNATATLQDVVLPWGLLLPGPVPQLAAMLSESSLRTVQEADWEPVHMCCSYFAYIDVMKNLGHLMRGAAHMGLQAFVTDGALLGAIRVGRSHEWDWDGDANVLADLNTTKRVLEYMDREHDCEHHLTTHGFFQVRCPKGGAALDVGPYADPDQAYCHAYGCRKTADTCRVSWLPYGQSFIAALGANPAKAMRIKYGNYLLFHCHRCPKLYS